MPPNSIPPYQPNSNMPPGLPTDGGAPVASNQVQSAYPPAEIVKPKITNYAAAVFFTLLVVGFTFHLPVFLYIPVVFFCIAAGIIFFKDILPEKKPKLATSQTGSPNTPTTVRKQRSKFQKVLITIAITMGILSIIYVGGIILLFIAIGGSGGI